MNYDDVLFELPVYGLCQKEKDAYYRDWLVSLGDHHQRHCCAYKSIAHILGPNPALPVRLFKEYDLRSTKQHEIKKMMTSSGTTGQAVSKIYLDANTSRKQTKALTKIVAEFTGKTRMPMLIIDTEGVLKNRNSFSARGAGILGFSMLGRDITYALDQTMELDLPKIERFCHKHEGEKVLLFGFTYIIWKHFYQVLKKKKICLHIDALLIHGGGWKKLLDESVTNCDFNRAISEVCTNVHVHNYYGMVEQTGSIYMECECGYLHASIFSDVVVRRVDDLSEANIGEKGIIECTSVLPESYPGHILLTEDEGVLVGIDDCQCGRKGKYFTVEGRIKGAEVRGCSDTYG